MRLNQKSGEMKKNITITTEDSLFERVSSLIEESRKQVAKAVNTAMVYTYYGVGQYIVEYEQEGKERAAYGQEVLQRLSARLTKKYGKGWSVDTLEKTRKLFLCYSNSATLSRKSELTKSATPQRISLPDAEILEEPTIHKFVLSWNHYQILMRIGNPLARNFYEVEAAQQQWSVRQLQRQVGSSLFERLALSHDKDAVMRLASEGQSVQKPSDITEAVSGKWRVESGKMKVESGKLKTES